MSILGTSSSSSQVSQSFSTNQVREKEAPFRAQNITDFPNEVLVHLFSFCELASRGSLVCVSRTFCQCSKEKSFLKQKILKKYVKEGALLWAKYLVDQQKKPFSSEDQRVRGLHGEILEFAPSHEEHIHAIAMGIAQMSYEAAKEVAKLNPNSEIQSITLRDISSIEPIKLDKKQCTLMELKEIFSEKARNLNHISESMRPFVFDFLLVLFTIIAVRDPIGAEELVTSTLDNNFRNIAQQRLDKMKADIPINTPKTLEAQEKSTKQMEDFKLAELCLEQDKNLSFSIASTLGTMNDLRVLKETLRYTENQWLQDGLRAQLAFLQREESLEEAIKIVNRCINPFIKLIGFVALLQ